MQGLRLSGGEGAALRLDWVHAGFSKKVDPGVFLKEREWEGAQVFSHLDLRVLEVGSGSPRATFLGLSGCACDHSCPFAHMPLPWGWGTASVWDGGDQLRGPSLAPRKKWAAHPCGPLLTGDHT